MQNEETKVQQGLTITTQSFINLDKASIRYIAMATVDNYLDGYKSPAEGLILAKKLSELSELLKENLADAAANELKLGKSEKYTGHNVEINEQMAGVKYNFDVCGDVLYDKAIKIVKEREAFLKTVKGEQITGDPETGETWMAKEPIKSGKMTLIVKIK